ncbi:hypothetical protein [Moorena sp. SIO2C4]|nr:hypothetical protein [Moorena sp. SIO2C4]
MRLLNFRALGIRVGIVIIFDTLLPTPYSLLPIPYSLYYFN